MKHCFIEILRRGDRVLNVGNGQLVVSRANGEVDIVFLHIDENGMPRIDGDRRVTITFGNGDVRIESAVEGSPRRASKRKAKPRSKKSRSPRKGHASQENTVITGSF